MKSLIIPLIIFLNIVITEAWPFYNDYETCSCNPLNYKLTEIEDGSVLCEEICGEYRVVCYNRKKSDITSDSQMNQAVDCEKELIIDNEEEEDDDDEDNIDLDAINYNHQSRIIFIMNGIAFIFYLILRLFIENERYKSKDQENNYNRSLNMANSNLESSKYILPTYSTADIARFPIYGNIIKSSYYSGSNYDLNSYEDIKYTNTIPTTDNE